ncbi:YeaC family protein [Photobacterium sp.]|uniref:YeaC family protein n=1 Tax=Photobacterium sp. TaxID=660 RepID=UPI00299D4680|nr:DUF1315 family protein [Photobacterium sp.]MDX1303739.1 DUF1315 family protein [Photobacterium sp.]
MDVKQLLAAMTPDVYQRILTAVEIGRWPDGTPLTAEQRDSALQAVMLYQSRHNTNAEHMSVEVGGEIKFKSKADLKREFGGESATQDDIARFGHGDM